MMSEPYTILKISWLTSIPGNEEFRELIVEQGFQIASFLQRNGLVNHRLIDGREDITDEFSLHTDDLTAEGLSLIEQAYDKWLGKIDKGMNPKDVTLLERTLKRIREMTD